LVDNIKYNGKISTAPMNTVVTRDSVTDAERNTQRQTAIQEGIANPKENNPIWQDFVEAQ